MSDYRFKQGEQAVLSYYKNPNLAPQRVYVIVRECEDWYNGEKRYTVELPDGTPYRVEWAPSLSPLTWHDEVGA